MLAVAAGATATAAKPSTEPAAMAAAARRSTRLPPSCVRPFTSAAFVFELNVMSLLQALPLRRGVGIQETGTGFLIAFRSMSGGCFCSGKVAKN
ncbi:hypothetical protein [Amycolatopsis sp. NPDC051371]|uniref:hypothetical protein n=1 Tax=Amycolatopsis sp. NPDC051371 TaxID=3155800 RepID=UPI003448520E